jgi:hypothetical protein
MAAVEPLEPESSMKKPILSGAMELLTVVWRQSQRTRQHSWRCLNGSMHEALLLAVSSGMEFGEDDFRYMAEHFRMGYWCGDLESFYKDAVEVRNTSAWKAYEKYRERKPYLLAPAVVGGNVTPARLVVGTKFEWQGENVTVTSFNDGDTPHLNACSYVISKGTQCNRCHLHLQYPENKILHRFKITYQDLKDEKKRMKAGAVAAAQGRAA